MRLVPIARGAAAHPLGVESAMARGLGRPRRDPALGALGGLAEQRRQALQRVLPVELLGAEAPGVEHQHTLLGHPAAGQTNQPALNGSCRFDGTYPQCMGGEIVFSGPNFNAQVHVKVTNSGGDQVDDGDYTTNGGVLTFVENLSFADTYTIKVDGQTLLVVTTS